MASKSQSYSYLCSTLKKMGYRGSLEDVREIKKFLAKSSGHPLYEKAVGHWNNMLNSSYVYEESPSDRLRSSSALYSSVHEGKR